MNELQVFNFKNNEVRTKSTNENIWFCLKDVCEILEISNSRKVVERLNEKGVTTSDTLTRGGIQKMTYINESNLYKVIFQSRKPQAEEFTEWVTGEVLPSIRRTGGYQLPSDPMQILKLTYDALSQTNESVAQHEYRIKELEDNQLLNPGEYNYISRAVKSKVKQVMSELNMDLKGKQKSQIYHAINRDLNCFIGIKTRSQFKAKDFDKALEFIENWQLSYTDKKIIEQMSLDI